MSAPLGNKNAAKAKHWSAAIERALERLADPTINPDEPVERSPKMKGLDMLADKFVASVSEGDLGFFKEFGDRFDGKPKQQMEISGDDENPLRIEKIVREVVKA